MERDSPEFPIALVEMVIWPALCLIALLSVFGGEGFAAQNGVGTEELNPTQAHKSSETTTTPDESREIRTQISGLNDKIDGLAAKVEKALEEQRQFRTNTMSEIQSSLKDVKQMLEGKVLEGSDKKVLQAQVPAITPLPKSEAQLLGDRFSISMGIKLWLVKWQTLVNFGQGQMATSQTVPLWGPTITGSLRLRKNSEWFHTVSGNFTWLDGRGFHFSSTTTPDPNTKRSLNRRDYSATGALAIWRGFGVFGGYYNMDQRFTIDLVNGTTRKNHSTISGPIIGVFGSEAVTDRLSLYGNFAVGFFDFVLDPIAPNLPSGFTARGVQGYSSEVGFTIMGPKIWKIGTSAQIGYRAQIITITLPDNRTGNDVTWGPIFQLTGIID